VPGGRKKKKLSGRGGVDPTTVPKNVTLLCCSPEEKREKKYLGGKSMKSLAEGKGGEGRFPERVPDLKRKGEDRFYLRRKRWGGPTGKKRRNSFSP